VPAHNRKERKGMGDLLRREGVSMRNSSRKEAPLERLHPAPMGSRHKSPSRKKKSWRRIVKLRKKRGDQHSQC